MQENHDFVMANENVGEEKIGTIGGVLMGVSVVVLIGGIGTMVYSLFSVAVDIL